MNRWALLGAGAVHAALLGYLFLGEAPVLKSEARRAPVRIRAATKAVPLPPPPPEPVAEPIRTVPEIAPAVQRATPRPARKEPPKQLARREAPPPAPVPVPTPAEPPPAAAPPPVQAAATPPPRQKKFTVALGATVSAGGVSVPVSASGSSWGLGGGAGADPDDEDAVDGPVAGGGGGSPSAGGAGAAGPGRRADVSELTTKPRLVYQPTEDEMRALYPELARRDALEGDVSLRILVSTSGEVLRVRVIKPAGHGFDDAAVSIVKRFRFRAAEARGEPVEVWIPWTYKFRLEG